MILENQKPRICSYCFREKPSQDFSNEHIWPDALGGDHLPSPWQTTNVCRRCNNISGLFIDGEFIKSWLGNIERVAGATEFLSPSAPDKSRFPPHFMGHFEHLELLPCEVAELWLGPCGANMVHIRTKHEPVWDTYAGGKPSKNRKYWGSAFLILASDVSFWVIVSIESFHHYFKNADRVVLNSTRPDNFFPPFASIDPNNVDQARRIRIARSVNEAALKKVPVKSSFPIKADVGLRLMAKLALGLGRELLGLDFLETSYANTLRQALWERDVNERAKLPVRGSGYFAAAASTPANIFFSWPKAWTLTIKRFPPGLALVVGTPTGRLMTVLISDEETPLENLNGRFDEGEVSITVPARGYALKRSLRLTDFIAHQTNQLIVPELLELATFRQNPSLLPPCLRVRRSK